MDINLYNDKYVRKLRENKFIIGYLVKTPLEYSNKKNVYENLVVDNILENVE